jgi:tetratricopeptide (TPR) repeat protein
VVKADKREAKLREFLAKLEAGQHVQNRDLVTWLGADWVGAISGAWAQQQELRQTFSEKPDAIFDYEELFRAARMLENRANVNKPSGKSQRQLALHEKAEVAYERLLERLQELLESDPSLCEWFDRVPDFTPGNSPSLCAEAMPQVRTSRSVNNMSSGNSMLASKRQVKISVLHDALQEIETARNPVTTVEKSSNRLERFLKNLDADTD